jgi:hypothetical protein
MPQILLFIPSHIPFPRGDKLGDLWLTICGTIPPMVNPFDRTFFKFLFGFLAILVFSFAVLYFADRDLGAHGLSSSLTAGQ